jgi:trk/ktr system potassium uptake protein
MSGDFAVIGLGRFGRAVALGLVGQKQSVLALDTSSDAIEEVAPLVDAAMTADATDEKVCDELKLERFSCVIVAIGAESMESSILATALLRQRGVPRIVARAVTDLHARVLRAVGAHEVVNPEAEMGARLASRLSQPNVLEQLAFDDNTTVAEIEPPAIFLGRSLVELDVRNRFGVSVVAVRRGDRVVSNPEASETLEPGDMMIVVGSPASVRKLGTMA